MKFVLVDIVSQLQVLVIEDSEVERLLVSKILTRHGFNSELIEEVSSIRNAYEKLDRHTYDVVILDLNLTDSEGLDSLDKILSRAPETPVVVLTGKDDEKIIFEALRRGAQDYIVKGDDLNNQLVKALVFAVERNKIRQAESTKASLEFGRLNIDLINHKCFRFEADKYIQLNLTPTELKILIQLVQNQGEIVSKQKLAEVLFSIDELSLGSQSIPTHISSLRKKIGEAYVIKFQGNGYGIDYDEQKAKTTA